MQRWKNIFTLLITTTSVCCAPLLKAQWQQAEAPSIQPRLEYLVETIGAPSLHTRDILQDQYGYIWVATVGGLFQYDGYTFHHFGSNVLDTTTLSETRIWDLFEDDRGNLWVATDSGLDLFDRSTRTFRHFLPHPAQIKAGFKHWGSVFSVFQDNQKRVWVGTSYGIALMDLDSMHFSLEASYYPLHKNRRITLGRHKFIQTPDNALWSIVSDGLYRFSVVPDRPDTIHVDRTIVLPRYTSIADAFDMGDGDYLLTTGEGLKSWHYLDTLISPLVAPPGMNENTADIEPASEKEIWISVFGQNPYLLNLQNHQYWQYSTDPLYATHNLNTGGNCLWLDDREDLWIGNTKGLWRLNLHPEPATLYRHDPSPTSKKNQIQQLVMDYSGRIYAASFEGIFRHAADRSSVEHLPFQLADGPYYYGARAMWVDDNNDVWASLVSRRGVGVYRCRPNEYAFTQMPMGETLSRAMTEVMQQDVGSPEYMWLGAYAGLYRVHKRTLEKELFKPKYTFPELPINRIRFLAQEGEHILWTYYMGGSAMGRFDQRTGEWEMIKPDPKDAWMLQGTVTDFKCRDQENIWISTVKGLVRFHIPTRAFSFFNENHGLPENHLRSATPDDYGNIWVSGTRTITQFRPEERYSRSMNVTRDMDAIGFSRLAPDGTLLVCGTVGFYAIDHRKFLPDSIAPRLVLTDFKVSDVSLPLSLPYEETRSIEISSRDNIITFDFVGLHFIQPEQNRYKCMLEGFDPDWRELGHQHSMTYTNLAPGEYRFKVLAANSDGLWTENPLSITLHVTPTFIQTLFFRILLIFLGMTIGYAIYRNRRQQLALRQKKEIAERSDEYKTKFLANISHEIRTPMNAILGMSKLLGDTKLNTKQQQYTGAICESSENLLQIVNDLLDHSKIESGQFKFVDRPFDLRLVLDQVMHTLNFRVQEKGITLDTKIEADVPQFVSGDPVRLNQVLLNLTGNATKFTEKGTVSIEVATSKISGDQALIQFVIRDTGIGIPKEKLHSIFDSFSQADDDTFVEYGGTGLGLSIVKELIEQQNGALEVESQVGAGSAFTFILPFGLAEKPLGESEPGRHLPKLAHLNVLVVDDTYFNQVLATELLKKHIKDVRIDIADNGEVALEKMQSKDYDVVLMDVRMPVMNGYEATRAIRKLAEEKRRNVPIIALTASAIRAQLDQCIAAGMNSYVTKPIDADELLNAIDNVVNQHQQT